MLKDILPKVIDGKDLTREEAAGAMETIMSGEATPAQIGAFLIALRMKGETSEEIAGCAEVMRRHATRVRASGTVIDTCGTGGDESGTFNISTAAALVAAGAGAKVAKHGNRSVSSNSGSADVLKTLGVRIDCEVPVVEECIEKANVGFLFAPGLHAAMKHAIGPRREIGARTVFNILGPLTNPAGAKRQIMGVFSRDLTEKLAKVLAALGAERALV
ncbi:MAG: anthranilate phosphoribosyltransferase, partial [Planctomycetota bacterium]